MVISACGPTEDRPRGDLLVPDQNFGSSLRCWSVRNSVHPGGIFFGGFIDARQSGTSVAPECLYSGSDQNFRSSLRC